MRDLVNGDIVTNCPKCGSVTYVDPEPINKIVNFGAVGMFHCDTCSHTCEFVTEKKPDRVDVFFNMSTLSHYKG